MTDATCAVSGCDRPVRALGMCRPHYRRLKETGDVRADIPIAKQVRHAPGASCAVEGCERPRKTKQWCHMHYRRWRSHGDPLVVAWIRCDDRARLESHIDRSGGPDSCHPWTAGRNAEGYGWTRAGHTTKGAHLAVWELENGPVPAGMELDHECHNQAVRDGLCMPGKCAHRLCCNLSHIIPRTRDDHAAATPGREQRVKGGNFKLTETQARELYALMQNATGGEVAEIASRFGVSRTHAYRIKKGQTWAWITGAAPAA